MRRVISNPEIVTLSDDRHLEMNDESWALIKDLLPLLKPPFLITKMLQDQNYPTIALIYPSLYVLYKKLEVDANDNSTFRAFKEEMKNKLSLSYYKAGYHTTLPMLSSAIDPETPDLSICLF